MTTTLGVATARTITRQADETEQEQAVNDVADLLRDAGFTVEGRAGDVRRGARGARGATKVARPPEHVKAESLCPIPSEAALDGEFTLAPELEKLAGELIERHRLYAGECQVTYLWRDKGGKTKGKPTLGKCTKPSGLLRHFSEQDFVIWLAADHLRNSGATQQEVEAVLFHELNHIGESQPPDDPEKAASFLPEPCLIGHDYEGFIDELQLYGTVVRDLRPIVATAQQLSLEIDE